MKLKYLIAAILVISSVFADDILFLKGCINDGEKKSLQDVYEVSAIEMEGACGGVCRADGYDIGRLVQRDELQACGVRGHNCPRGKQRCTCYDSDHCLNASKKRSVSTSSISISGILSKLLRQN